MSDTSNNEIQLTLQKLRQALSATNSLLPQKSRKIYEKFYSEFMDWRISKVSLAETLSERARVLCWILTIPENHHGKATSIKDTWGPRCNVLLFMSSQNDTSLPAVGLPVREGRDYLWGKTKEAFKYIYKHHLNDADWFLKADDDTYVIVENLRFLLSGFNTTEPLYLGCKFKLIGDPDAVKQGYMSGGAGYVLSKEALTRFVEKGISNPDICQRGDYGTEDLEVGKCMENLGVKAVDTRDSLGRGRFFPFIPEQHLTHNHSAPDYWLWEAMYHPYNEGSEKCSERKNEGRKKRSRWRQKNESSWKVNKEKKKKKCSDILNYKTKKRDRSPTQPNLLTSCLSFQMHEIIS